MKSKIKSEMLRGNRFSWLKLVNHLLSSTYSIFKKNKEVYILTSLLWLFYQAMSIGLDFDIELPIYSLMIRLYSVFTFFLLLYLVYYFFLLIYKKEKKPLRSYKILFLTILKDKPRVVSFVTLSLCVAITGCIYSSFKQTIPVIMPYYLDKPLYQFEQWALGGMSPWEVTHWIFSSPISTLVINIFYNIWFFYILLFIAIILSARDSQLKNKAFIAFFLVWFINGNVFATLLSSVGPCFYDYLHPENPAFSQLMQLLNQQNHYLSENYGFNLWALNTQDMLWDRYINKTSQFGVGITAMPSMHNSMAILIALVAWQKNKVLGYSAWIFAAIIYIGSIHLAWHYASDGIVAFALTISIWKIVGYYFERNKDKAMTEQDEKNCPALGKTS